MTAEGLEAEYCKILEYIPAENRLLVRAGVRLGCRGGRLGECRGGFGVSCRLCSADRQASYFQPS